MQMLSTLLFNHNLLPIFIISLLAMLEEIYHQAVLNKYSSIFFSLTDIPPLNHKYVMESVMNQKTDPNQLNLVLHCHQPLH